MDYSNSYHFMEQLVQRNRTFKWFSYHWRWVRGTCEWPTRAGCVDWRTWIQSMRPQYSVWGKLASPGPSQAEQPPNRPRRQSMCPTHCTVIILGATPRCDSSARMCRRRGTAAFSMVPRIVRLGRWWMPWVRPTAWVSPRSYFDTTRPLGCKSRRKTVWTLTATRSVCMRSLYSTRLRWASRWHLHFVYRKWWSLLHWRLIETQTYWWPIESIRWPPQSKWWANEFSRPTGVHPIGRNSRSTATQSRQKLMC